MKIGMLFPGYGSQYVGMAKELYDESRTVQEYFEDASNCLKTNFVKLCFASSDSDLSRIENAYTSTFLVSCAIHALLKEEGIVPEVLAGYNLGEYAAIYAAGGLTFPDGLYLLNKYASIYEEALASMNVGVIRVQGISTKMLELMCKEASSKNGERVFIAFYNSPTDHVVAGHTDAVAEVRGHVSRDPETTIGEMSVDVGLHSVLMQEVADKLAVHLEIVDFNSLAMPMICSADVCRVETGDQVRARVIEHVHTPVKWDTVMQSLADCDVLVEVGPGTMLSAMAKVQYPDKIVMSINKRSDITDLKKILEPQAPTPEI